MTPETAAEGKNAAANTEQEQPRLEKLDVTLDNMEQNDTPGAQPINSQDNQEIIAVNMENEAFPDVLKRARANKSVTISDVSQKTHIPASFIHDIENACLNNLPDLDLCLTRLEKLSLEYGIDDATSLKDNFTEAYETFHKDDLADKPSPLINSGLPNVNLYAPRSRSYSLPSIIIISVIVMLVALLGYAYFAYKGHQLPSKLDVNLSELVPIHKPDPVYLDEPARQ